MQIFSVSQFLAYINDTFRAIWDPQAVALEGEVSGFRISQGQWVNFDLKDGEAQVSVFMVVRQLTMPLQDGMRVRLYGYPRVYPKYGKFSFSADRVELVGEGTLRKALALLRQKLEREGLFDPARKRVLPRFPQRIALVASRESAAYGDFLRILQERWGGLTIDVYHVLVQGDKAAESIVKAIEAANTAPSPSSGRRGIYDALVLTRGGGSLEELMPFNDERVARAIFASKIPTLVGIGHERDLTLAEEVADVRASTPTDCARRLVPDRREVLFEIATTTEHIADTLGRWVEDGRRALDRVWQNAEAWVQDLRQRLGGLTRVLRSLDPRAILKRGYTFVTDATGHVQISLQGLSMRQNITVHFSDGNADALVQRLHPD